jgi:DNA-binding NarL/FixJ family response regulator
MIKVLLVDDHEIFRHGMQFVLSRMEGIEIVAEATNGRECIDLLDGYIPDLIFMDVQMPVLNGIEATQIIRRLNPDIKVVALSMFGEEKYLQGMIEAGAVGFLLKNIERSELSIAIDQLINGRSYYSPELLPYFTNKFLPERELSDGICFTKREIDVLRQIALGKSNGEIADTLFISKRTVEGHKANLIAKTGSKNVLSLLVYAIKHNLVKIK